MMIERQQYPCIFAAIDINACQCRNSENQKIACADAKLKQLEIF